MTTLKCKLDSSRNKADIFTCHSKSAGVITDINNGSVKGAIWKNILCKHSKSNSFYSLDIMMSMYCICNQLARPGLKLPC